ncbi:unnamed protein product [Cylindrotheca closterium]|uniref:Uncharacterized protein n=1 Tax=Cylindrotheca closterium TaxID=2856 RepID=A0AAD2FM91_9STRA|nr:unnamed protein product [Cylindrotheca closterium]
MHQGDYEKEVLLSSLENGSGTIASLQMSVEEGLEQSRATLFSSLECLPLSPDQVGCDQYLQTFRAAKRSKSAIKIQALTRGMLTRNEVEPVKNAFLLNVQKLILQKMSCCRRFVRDEDEQTVDEDEDEDDDMIAPAA